MDQARRAAVEKRRCETFSVVFWALPRRMRPVNEHSDSTAQVTGSGIVWADPTSDASAAMLYILSDGCRQLREGILCCISSKLGERLFAKLI